VNKLPIIGYIKYKYLIINTLETEKLRQAFGLEAEMTTEHFYDFFRAQDQTIPRSTVNWRIYELVKNGILKRIGKGKFEWGAKAIFYPEIDDELKELDKEIKLKYPFIKYCIWNNAIINPFHQHLMWSKFTLIDVEKELMDTTFNFLLRDHKSVYLKPTPDIMDRYILNDHSSIVIRQLITESPLQIIEGVSTLTIEKLLVDIFSDDEFEYLKGSELVSIFKNIFSRYTVNRSKMARYADRKGKQEKILTFMAENQITKPSFENNNP
jgi:hypothetical protein